MSNPTDTIITEPETLDWTPMVEPTSEGGTVDKKSFAAGVVVTVVVMKVIIPAGKKLFKRIFKKKESEEVVYEVDGEPVELVKD